MNPYVFEPTPQPSLAVAGSEQRVPVRRIYCVARNYAAHAREMGAEPARDAPFFFGKPADTVVGDGAAVAYPPATRELHHEVELVVVLGRSARDVAVADAPRCIYGYAVGLDLTRRDLQRAAKAAGRPWEAAKAFDCSAPVGVVHPAAEIGHPERGAILLEVNGTVRQQGDLRDQIWGVPELLAQLSTLVELRPGDLVFTGTPAGVGPLAVGDWLRAEIEGVGTLSVQIVRGRLEQ